MRILCEYMNQRLWRDSSGGIASDKISNIFYSEYFKTSRVISSISLKRYLASTSLSFNRAILFLTRLSLIELIGKLILPDCLLQLTQIIRDFQGIRYG